MKAIRNIIIIFIIIILCIGIVLLFIKNNKQKKEDTNNNNIISSQEEKEKTTKKNLEEVKSATMFFTVQSCINKYLGYVNNKDNDSIYKTLDIEYIKKNNITKSNVLNKIDQTDDALLFNAEKMYMENIDDNNIKYYAKGVLQSEAGEDYDGETTVNRDCKMIVNLDFENMIFSVMPLEDGGIFDEEKN